MPSKRLIITEKPRVAEHIAKALGLVAVADSRGKWYQNSEWLCVAARGHLLRLATPDELNPQWKRWSFHNLPIVPEQFRLIVPDTHRPRLELIFEKLRDPVVDAVVNACDPGREGELIFREIYHASGESKPVKRMWLPTLAPEEIKSEAADLRPGDSYDSLFASARTRAKVDWLMGMNLTRAVSLRMGQRQAWPVGRVQTPTLAFLVDRERQRRVHSPKERFALEFANVASGQRCFVAELFQDQAIRKRYFETRQAAKEYWSQQGSLPITVVAHTAPISRTPPPPPHLLDLQRTCHIKWGWTAQKTLQVAQSLYDQHRVISYPRTDCRQLPSAELAAYTELAKNIVSQRPLGVDWASETSLAERSYFVEKLEADHHAIIPTALGSSLAGAERDLYELIAKCFVSTLLDNAQLEYRSLRGQVGEELKIQSEPRCRIKQAGYLVLESKQTSSDGARDLPPSVILDESPLAAGEEVPPPPAFTEATLLSAMERAGETVKDADEQQALLLARGLGTAATRHQIIESLKSNGYVTTDLKPTPKGEHLIAIINQAELDWLCSPRLSAQLELQLSTIVADPSAESETLARMAGKLMTATQQMQHCQLPPTPNPQKSQPFPVGSRDTGSPQGAKPAVAQTTSQPQPGRKRLADCPVHGPPCAVVAVRDQFICETRLAARLAGKPATGYFSAQLPNNLPTPDAHEESAP